MKLLIIIILIGSSQVFSASLFEQIKVSPQFSAILQQSMLNHLDQVELTTLEKQKVIDNLKTINQHLLKVDLANTQAFLFSEFFKNFYDFSNSPELQVKAYISNSNIIAAREKLNQYKSLYTSFAKFHIQDLIENYEPLLNGNILNNYKNITKREQIKSEQRDRIELLNRHVGPWIMQFMRLKTEQFNAMCTKYILRYFENMAIVSRFFQNSVQSQTENPLFILPSENNLEALINQSNSKSNSNQENSPSPTPKNSAKDVMEINVEPGEAAAEKIDELIENVDKTPE